MYIDSALGNVETFFDLIAIEMSSVTYLLTYISSFLYRYHLVKYHFEHQNPHQVLPQNWMLYA